MKSSLFLSAALLAGLATPSAQGRQLNLIVRDNGAVVGAAVSTSGSLADRITSDPAFDVIDVSGSGAPFLPGGDLSSVTINVTSRAITTTHTLNIELFQTGLNVPGGFHTLSTFTTNNLIGVPGPTTEGTFINGTASTLGTELVSHTFPTGTTLGSFGPITVTAPAISADAHQYLLGFTHPDQSSNDTIQLTTGVPETSTWVMLGIGFVSMAAASAFRIRSLRFLEV